MTWELIADWVGLALIVVGSIFMLIAAIGVFRFRDLLTIQHIATKPQVFSLIMLMLGVSLMVRSSTMTWTMLLVIGFQLITSPISAHMMSRAGYRTNRIEKNSLVLDELSEDIEAGDER
ncbi:monovalent cation/H(+) antiporter subunit G [Trueperella pyogenes]|uniref:Monovalent cation/H(+) antiporter subunit G n=1 Tax=Trueperella pyogenes TaxID=1661 RepID=A0ABV3NAF0_9ACTO|nr:monovalent cation/H(+) antiporter subunit G [Trueperella pyogenes]AJC70219.1 cation:proton antiporter [Trueperella pyogenes TP8]ALD73311.1 sodium:proton antiporter [Trueperella pyogenes]AZR01481.1 Na+/H+ antiporter subunit G [Trueperella pyogenes]AZR02741.1 Na+/H+ antiporter subunit G [Trueperella pyogenes]MBB3025356.1 multicomponent Na+:H+ antiporter subunit G [Trueperella pyogenes]